MTEDSQPITVAEWVLLATSSANTDPDHFADPDRLDLGREPGGQVSSGHVSFGHGAHYCLGAPLARMQARVAFGALLEHFPGLSLAAAPEDLRWRPGSLMHGLEALPVRVAGSAPGPVRGRGTPYKRTALTSREAGFGDSFIKVLTNSSGDLLTVPYLCVSVRSQAGDGRRRTADRFRRPHGFDREESTCT